MQLYTIEEHHPHQDCKGCAEVKDPTCPWVLPYVKCDYCGGGPDGELTFPTLSLAGTVLDDVLSAAREPWAYENRVPLEVGFGYTRRIVELTGGRYAPRPGAGIGPVQGRIIGPRRPSLLWPLALHHWLVVATHTIDTLRDHGVQLPPFAPARILDRRGVPLDYVDLELPVVDVLSESTYNHPPVTCPMCGSYYAPIVRPFRPLHLVGSRSKIAAVDFGCDVFRPRGAKHLHATERFREACLRAQIGPIHFQPLEVRE